MLRMFLPLVALTLAAQTPAPKADAPKPEAPKTQVPKVEAPKAAAVKTEAPKTEAPKAVAPKVDAAAKPAVPAEDKILARIGDTLIRESDLESALNTATAKERAQITAIQGAKEQFATRMIEMHLLAAKAKKLGLDATPEHKRAAEMMRTQLLATELLKKETDGLNLKMTVTEEDAKAYYEKNKTLFMAPGKFSARHILVAFKSEKTNGQGYTEQEAQERVGKIQAELKAGKKLEDLAKDWSDDPGSKEKGGLYENISYGQFVPEFEVAVKNQDLGKVGAPVKTNFGYHFIQVEKKDDGAQQAYDQVKEEVKKKATEVRREQVWNSFIGDIKKEIPFELNPDPKKLAAPGKPAAKPAAKKA